MSITLSTSEAETIKLGQKYGSTSKGGEIYLLTGDLGGGKTQFTKGLAQGLGIKDSITSPTFNFQNIYPLKNGLTLYHFDLYRSDIVDPDVRDMMLESFADPKGVTVVEWAERARDYWPKGATILEFDWVSENERQINAREN